jgi:hypothetical protein
VFGPNRHAKLNKSSMVVNTLISYSSLLCVNWEIGLLFFVKKIQKRSL